MKISIKAIIINSGFTQRDIANILGINESTFSMKLKGLRAFKENEICVLCNILNITEDELLGSIENAKRD